MATSNEFSFINANSSQRLWLNNGSNKPWTGQAAHSSYASSLHLVAVSAQSQSMPEQNQNEHRNAEKAKCSLTSYRNWNDRQQYTHDFLNSQSTIHDRNGLFYTNIKPEEPSKALTNKGIKGFLSASTQRSIFSIKQDSWQSAHSAKTHHRAANLKDLHNEAPAVAFYSNDLF